MVDTQVPQVPAAHRRPRRRIHWAKAALPALVVLLGLFLVAPVAGTLAGKLTGVTENDQSAFLPDSAESTRSLALETQFAGTQDIPALVVWERPEGLTDATCRSRAARPAGSAHGPYHLASGGGPGAAAQGAPARLRRCIDH